MNGVGLCRIQCHPWAHAQKDEFRTWIGPDLMRYLERLSQSTAKVDVEMRIEFLKGLTQITENG